MRTIKINSLLKILEQDKVEFEDSFHLSVSKNIIDTRARELLHQTYSELGGTGEMPLLPQLKYDFKIDRFLFLYDDANHFNRYRLITLKSNVYNIFTYSWTDNYKRLCRTYERECLKGGLQERIWFGPPVASRCFGPSEEAGDLSGNGSPGWKLNAYNDAQYDLFTRLMGYKMIRISVYENLMIRGGLKKIDQLLTKPDPDTQKAILKWLLRKLE